MIFEEKADKKFDTFIVTNPNKVLTIKLISFFRCGNLIQLP